MSETVFSFPGKTGDAIHQWPIAYWWAKENNKQFTCWMDERSCKVLKPLFESQSCVAAVEFKPGIENYACGGQPWHFGMDTADYTDKTVYHLGLRRFPQRQLTLECQVNFKATLKVDQETLSETPSFETAPGEKWNRLLLHGQPVYAHTKGTPGFWRFLASIRGELESLFQEIVWIGDERDLEVGKRTYPDWSTFEDQGDFKKLADYMATSEAVIGVGSSLVALAGALKLPCIRVHDKIGDHPKAIWSNLGSNQINDTEIELRKTWPTFRDQWLKKEAHV